MAGYIGSKASVVSSGAERKKTFTITGATTSLTGLNYTVGKVHVFQNGVRLVDGTDYTATNGTTITLTVAAQNGDNVVVISQASFQVADALLTSGGTMTGDLTVQGTVAATAVTGDGSGLTGTGSPSIDDNGNATAITIDSNENVMLGNTVANPASGFASQAGFGYTGSTGVVEIATTANAAPLEIGKNNANDGQLIALRKQGTVVGSIGTVGNQSYIHGAGTDVGIYFGSNNLYPYRSTGLNDATIDLGQSSKRFKDAYLSGGVYLGGTGAANKLEDYEEGTWSPSSVGASIGVNGSKATYTKIGNTVIASAELNIASNSNNAQLRVSLPFTVGYVSDGGVIRYSNAGSNVPSFVVSNDNNADVVFYNSSGGASTFAEVSNKRVDFLIIYRV